MATTTNPFIRFLAALNKIFRLFRSLVLNLIFIFIVLLVIGSLIQQPVMPVPQGAALVLNPYGIIVEQKSFISPVDMLFNESLGASDTSETLLQDVLDAINLASTDNTISSIVLLPGNMQGAGFSHLQDIGQALLEFKSSGKKIYALADNYTQGQYYLAAFADEVILNSYGSIDMEGFSAYQNYFGEALEKIGVNIHIFRVGEYKSAVEPYERNDMSPEAKQNYTLWLSDLWNLYLQDVNEQRDLNEGFLTDLLNNMDAYLNETAGDTARLALENGLVDRLLSRSQAIEFLKSEIGANTDGSFLQVDYQHYLGLENSRPNTGSPDIALIVAKGTIYDGERQAGEIGGDSLSQLIRQAREEDNAALVLRIDSGGGSAFASEIIRNELLEYKATGRPIIVSMGSVAASGGYWIATPADQIWASPSTITGSIGIFAIYPTFENTFATLGIGTDGVGTTPLAGAFTVGNNLPDVAVNSLQLILENGYSRFLDIVAESRNMGTLQVDAIAQGQVWSGQAALENGLVDNLGNLDDAINAAATLANLPNYEIKLLETPLSPGEQFIKDFMDNVLIKSIFNESLKVQGTDIFSNMASNPFRIIRAFSRNLENLLQLNDPNAMYLHCMECEGLIL